MKKLAIGLSVLLVLACIGAGAYMLRPQPQAARIIHYAGRRDYHKAPLWREYEAMSWPEEAP